jgi:HD-GYP domain-containing protein (c-di-GMP phosphodiesterase class II)
MVKHHHERYDGKGYPQGLSGEDIPLLARIIAIADAYSALISPRPYRPAYPPQQAMRILIEEAGKQFDPQLMKVFTLLYEAGLLT